MPIGTTPVCVWAEHADGPRDEFRADVVASRKRGHWIMENGLHHVKDVSLGEDQSLIHQGQGPAVMALLRDAAISLLVAALRTAAAVALLVAALPTDA